MAALQALHEARRHPHALQATRCCQPHAQLPAAPAPAAAAQPETRRPVHLQVDAVREARMEAQQARYELERAHGELGDLRRRVAALSAQQRPAADAATTAGAGDSAALEAARLEAADARCCQQLAELELAKQLDALQELQWQLDCVVAQLGLTGGDGGAGSGAGATPAAAQAPEQHLPLLLAKVEELRHAQLELGETKRWLAAAEASLAHARSCQQPAAELRLNAEPGGAPEAAELSPRGHQLVGQLLRENEELRQRLAEAEVSAGRAPCHIQHSCLSAAAESCSRLRWPVV